MKANDELNELLTELAEEWYDYKLHSCFKTHECMVFKNREDYIADWPAYCEQGDTPLEAVRNLKEILKDE